MVDWEKGVGGFAGESEIGIRGDKICFDDFESAPDGGPGESLWNQRGQINRGAL